MPDAVETQVPAEPATVDEPAGQRSSRKPTPRKKTKRPTRKASKPAAGASSTVRVKVAGHAIAMPKTLAEALTAKDKKKLAAIFKRVLRREKKRGVKKRAAKKR